MVNALAFHLLCVAWGLSEVWLGLRRRSEDTARQRDRGSLRLLLVVVYGSVALGLGLGFARVLPIATPLSHVLAWTGVAMMLLGIALRWWSIRVLAQWFTVDVAIRPGHQLVRHGPYRHLRHPSYTGALMTFLGFALALGSWAALPVVAIPVIAAFLWRIRIEEQALRAAFPGDYAAYAGTTKRLIPFLW